MNDPVAVTVPLSAADVVARVRGNVGVAWREPTVDTFKAGDPATPVRGVAVAMMPTLVILRQAVAADANLVIVHEPAFYSHEDNTELLEKGADRVYLAKDAFIRAYGLVIWRLHDHVHQMKPDLILHGMMKGLGWEKFQMSDHPGKFALHPRPLRQLAAELAAATGAKALRLVGDPGRIVSKVALSPGYASLPVAQRFLNDANVELLIVGETREWETVPYAQDLIALGEKKALLILGHLPSEEYGMRETARWLQTLLPELKVHFFPAPAVFTPL